MPLDQEMKAEKEDQNQTTLTSGRELTDNELESIIGATATVIYGSWREPSGEWWMGRAIPSKS
jgi:hypothetical protein